MAVTASTVAKRTIADVCDRHASARAYTAWYRPDDRLVVTLCAHCAHEHDVALTEQRFELRIDIRDELDPADDTKGRKP